PPLLRPATAIGYVGFGLGRYAAKGSPFCRRTTPLHPRGPMVGPRARGRSGADRIAGPAAPYDRRSDLSLPFGQQLQTCDDPPRGRAAPSTRSPHEVAGPSHPARYRGPVTTEDVLEALARVTAALPVGEERPGQEQMASAVSVAIRTKQHLAVQAGTGT